MDLSRNKVGLFIFVQFLLLGKVLPCPYDVLSGNKLECGINVLSEKDCPKTCCFNKTKLPACYFQENVYGPIKHPNGLCVNVESGTHTDGTRLIWSRDCTTSDAFFLVSYDHPPFHLASGKCVLPKGRLYSPGTLADLFLDSRQSRCNRDLVTYRSTDKGNLEYFYSRGSYELCVGTWNKNIWDDGPKENDPVSIPKSQCRSDGSCANQLSYVYQRKFANKNVNFKCVLGRTIKVIWASYGVQDPGQYPLKISTSHANCVTTTATSVVQGKCDGKTQCDFTYRDSDFLQSSCRDKKILLVRYTCKTNAVPAAPSDLLFRVENGNKLLLWWSNDASTDKNPVTTKFKLCRTKDNCCNFSSSEASPNKTVLGLMSATAYNITVARYSCDGKTIGLKAHKIITTRSAPLKVGEIDATSFEITLGKFQRDDKYAQIVVSKLRSKTIPTKYPKISELSAHDESTVDNKPYIAAELDRTYLDQNSQFIVGDGKTYDRSSRRKRRNTNGFVNVKLQPDTFYSVFQRTFKTNGLHYDSDWMDVIKTKTLPPTTTPSVPSTSKPTSDSSTKGGVLTTGSIPRDTTTKESGGGDPVGDDQDGGSGSGLDTAIIGAAAGGGVLLIVLTILVIVFIRRRKRNNSNIHLYDKPVKYKNVKKRNKRNEEQENQNTLSSANRRGESPDVITAHSGDVYAMHTTTKKKHVPESEYQNAGFQNETYANLQVESPEEGKGVKISRFLFYVEEMKKDQNFGFQNEFKELPVGQTRPWEEGRKAENVPKNRYANNTAYDHSRVVLTGEENYINANFVKGVESEVYIAAQGPTEKTVNDFWRMVWEHNCSCIIALTNIVEVGKMKCVQYWSDDEADFGEIHVKTAKTELFADYIIRYIYIKKGDKGKKISQYHFTSWPDHGVPKYPTKLLAFRHRFRALHSVSAQPIVVHCSGGVGRTGTFIAVDITLLRLNQLKEQTINIRDTVYDLRNERVDMVQTLEQYILVHDAVLEMILCGFTEIEAGNLKTEVERLKQKELNKSFTGFEIEFKKLASVCHPLSPEECTSALNQKNKSKNRDSNIYPSENLRVFLCGSEADEDRYINATYIHGYTHARAYIATQAPLSNTINDFWQMVFEKQAVVVVMLNNVSEGETVYPQYWVEDFNQEKQYGRLFVKMVSALTRGPIISRKFVITNKTQSAAVREHMVRHVQFTDWPEHGVPGNLNDVMDLLDSVEEAQQRSTNGVVIVHCSNGAQRTGTYLTLAIQRERVRTEHVVDIFRCIKILREQCPQFVGNVEQYKFCYDAMLTFVESFKTYDNIPKV